MAPPQGVKVLRFTYRTQLQNNESMFMSKQNYYTEK